MKVGVILMPSSDYYDFYAVLESAVEAGDRNASFKITGEGKRPNGDLSFLRYQGCMMTVGKRNRNRRLWTKQIVAIMMRAPHIEEQLHRAGGLPGENGHPIPDTAQVTMERLVTIDPNNLAILLKEWWWDGDKMMGTVETLDQGEGTPGNRLMMNMIQGIVPAHSARTMVPQRRNPDGSIDVTGPGRMVCFDRVHGPSCEEAYQNVSIPVKNIVKKAEFDTAMESFSEYILAKSEAAKRVIDGLQPAMESATVTTDGMYSVKTLNEGRIFVPVERSLRGDIADFMRSF
jgi:hypothetical protein